ncbi:uncharacterized protein LOC135703113 [Ochlerotatus camptorhynchus]|uniref:uncharacterized protein LOC135703113 n=1 Tax=Ochlerotatus camptorhynchus TaxID=644619 RepID=UPI0031DE94EE
MQIPSVDPTGYCRLCFSQHQLRWLLQSSDNPMVAQIQICLGVALTPEVDFPCTVCRLCSAALETFEALRERAQVCDAILSNSRVGESPSFDSDVVECKQECASPEPELLIEEVLPSSVAQEEPSVNADFLSSGNTIMVGDIKVELLNVHSEGSNSITTQWNEKPTKSKKTPRKIECQVCKLAFVKESNLEKHMNLKHSSKHDADAMAAAVAATRLRHPQKRPGELNPISPKDIRKQMNMYIGSENPTHYCCNRCNAQFRQWHTFQRHRKTHDDVDGGSNLQNGTSS